MLTAAVDPRPAGGRRPTSSSPPLRRATVPDDGTVTTWAGPAAAARRGGHGVRRVRPLAPVPSGPAPGWSPTGADRSSRAPDAGDHDRVRPGQGRPARVDRPEADRARRRPHRRAAGGALGGAVGRDRGRGRRSTGCGGGPRGGHAEPPLLAPGDHRACVSPGDVAGAVLAEPGGGRSRSTARRSWSGPRAAGAPRSSRRAPATVSLGADGAAGRDRRPHRGRDRSVAAPCRVGESP